MISGPSVDPATAYDGLVAVTDSVGAPLVNNRVPTVAEANSIYQQLKQGDQASRLNRYRIKMQLMGAPPYPPEQLRKHGLADIANVNFLFMSDALDIALSPFTDLLDSSECLTRCPVDYGEDPQQRLDWGNTVDRELTTLITQAEGFDYDFNVLCQQFILEGIAAPYWPDTIGIEWSIGTVADFLIPRHTRAKASAVEVCCVEKFYLAHELFTKIQKVDAARKEGWNVEQTWQCIKDADSVAPYDQNPERYQTDLKDNDFTYQARSKEIRTVHMFVRSLNGAVSHLQFDADGNCKDFMYRSLDKFSQQSECFTIFTYGVGTTEFYHGIRGLGYKLDAVVKEMNEIWSAFLDALRNSGKMVIKPGTEADLRKLALVQFGHYLVMPPNCELQAYQMPDLSRTLLPGMNVLSSMYREKAASYSAPDQFATKATGKLKALSAKFEELANLSVTKMNVFYKSWEQLLREQVRRIIRRDWHESDPGYERVMGFFQACKDEGVPREAIHSLDLRKLRAVRPVGAGSRAARKQMMENLKDPISKCDEEGQYQFTRDQIRFEAGTEAADRYAPRKQGLRPPQDKTIAGLENGLMDLGQPPVFEINQLHPVHADVHLKHLGELIQQSDDMVEQLFGPNAQETDINQITPFQMAPVMKAEHDHIKQHMDKIPEKLPGGEPNAQRKALAEAYQQSGEAVNNNLKHYLRLMRQQQKQGAQGQQPQGQGQGESDAPPGETITADKKAEQAIAMEQTKFEQAQAHEEAAHQAQMRRAEEAHQLQLKLKMEQVQQEIAIEKARKDALAATDITNKIKKAAA